MVKISVLQHDLATHLPTRPGDPTPVQRNLNPLMHPFSRARERTRALNAAKMDRMFAKPFIDSLEGHIDAVEVLCRQPGSLTTLASGSWDGGIILHNLSTRNHIMKIPQAHKGKVSGLCFSETDGGKLLSCGVDRNVKLWGVSGESESLETPLNVFPGKAAFNSIDHHRTDPLFATASNTVQIWDETKSTPISNLTFPTSSETITSVRFNMSESSVLASTGSDRTFTLYDIRTGKAERRIVMQMQTNALAWSPTFPTTVLMASEDHNLYTFDIRKLDTPSMIYKAHVAAVMSCDWSPTGTEFVSGGWDRTVRIWKEGKGHAPEVYHTKRMQRVTSTVFSADARFVMSGSDDGNVRIWKANASEKLGVVTARERATIEYRDKLKERWMVDKEVERVVRTRHLPKSIKQTNKLKATMLDARRVKEERRRKHTRSGESKPKPERKKVVIVEQT
ncbi:WD40 repeat-like protein [Panaeolus papilionaceus]|nr:WD40 repeat-like protein [Panaeolus papilionaceus]